jgi:Acetyltransferase (GNAT) domain
MPTRLLSTEARIGEAFGAPVMCCESCRPSWSARNLTLKRRGHLSVSYREFASTKTTFRDMPLSDVSRETRDRLERSPEESWLSSLGFAESYCFPPADRVSFLEDSAGNVVEKCFYRDEKWTGLLKRIEVCGPIDPESSLLQELQRCRGASIIRVQWMPAPNWSRWKATWSSRTAERIGEDYCIHLPHSSSEYLQRLGSKTRRHLPYYVRRLQKQWGADWTFAHQYGGEIARQSYDSLLDLNGFRMNQMGRKSGWTNDVRQHRWKSAQSCGLLCSLRYKDRIVAGTLSFVHSNHAYLIVVAHDPQFNTLNLGTVSLWLTVEHLIHKGYGQFHLMWGRSFYKEQFGGELKPLFRVTTFTNPMMALVWRAVCFSQVATGWRLAAKACHRLSRSLLSRRDMQSKSSLPKEGTAAGGTAQPTEVD